MKIILFFITISLLFGCGGGSNKGNTQVFECAIEEHTVNLLDGEACVVTEAHLESYAVEQGRVSPGITVCNDGFFVVNGLTFESGTIFGQTFYGLTVNCESSSGG